MRLLNGEELAEFVKERQAHEVRGLRQAWHVEPKLAIVTTIDHPAAETYMRMKQQYGADILVDVAIHKVSQDTVPGLIEQLNNDSSIHGIIVQLPLEQPEETDKIVSLVAPEKDVDALGGTILFDPATPMAILWLLAGYNVELKGKQVLLIGRGKLVGAPLERILISSGINVTVADISTKDLKAESLQADVIITATGSPGVLTSDMIKPNTVVVDAGVTGEDGKIVGDVAPDVYDRQDLTLTPPKGGVGPLTVCALFENVIRAARQTAKK